MISSYGLVIKQVLCYMVYDLIVRMINCYNSWRLVEIHGLRLNC
jgi:hypothetical protein